MRRAGFRSLGVVPATIAGVVALGVSSTVIPGLPTGCKTVLADARLLDTESWIIGGSGVPIPPIDTFVNPLNSLYISPTTPFFTGQPTFTVDKVNPLFTPEGLYPNSGVKSLELDPSLAQGVSILHSTITGQVGQGNSLVVLGYSQSSTIATMEMRDLMALPTADQPTADQLKFVLLGDPNNPNGGFFERFDVFGPNNYPTIPSLGITLSGATPADTPWDTTVYTLEYDGYADFPRYPINLLSDLNAVLGIQYEHTMYPDLGPGDAGPGQLTDAILLPGSHDYSGVLPAGVDAATSTNYYMIPSEILPLLEPLQLIPVAGKPLYDLLEPDTRILVDLGYGNVDSYGTDGLLSHGGWDTGPANVPTTYGLFPSGINLGELLNSLGQGSQHGINAFLGDLGGLPHEIGNLLTGLPGDLTGAAAHGGSTTLDVALPSLTDIVNSLSSAASTAYATLLPTADILNAMVTTLPAYGVSLIADELSHGDLVDAIGMPIAGAFGLGSVAAGFEFLVMLLAGVSIVDDLQTLIPF